MQVLNVETETIDRNQLVVGASNSSHPKPSSSTYALRPHPPPLPPPMHPLSFMLPRPLLNVSLCPFGICPTGAPSYLDSRAECVSVQVVQIVCRSGRARCLSCVLLTSLTFCRRRWLVVGVPYHSSQSSWSIFKILSPSARQLLALVSLPFTQAFTHRLGAG